MSKAPPGFFSRSDSRFNTVPVLVAMDSTSRSSTGVIVDPQLPCLFPVMTSPISPTGRVPSGPMLHLTTPQPFRARRPEQPMQGRVLFSFSPTADHSDIHSPGYSPGSNAPTEIMDAAQAPDIAELNHDLDTIHSILEQDPNNIHPSHEPDSMRDSDKPTDGDKQHLSDVAASSGPVEPPANDPKEDFAPSSTNQQVVKIEILEDEDLDMIVPRYEKVELDPTKPAEFDTSPSLDHPMAHPVVSAGVQNVEGIRQVAAPWNLKMCQEIREPQMNFKSKLKTHIRMFLWNLKIWLGTHTRMPIWNPKMQMTTTGWMLLNPKTEPGKTTLPQSQIHLRQFMVELASPEYNA